MALDINLVVDKKPRINDARQWLTEEDEDEDISYNVSAKWRELGIALGLREDALEEISEQKGNAARLDGVLNKWISTSKTCTWLKLIEALQGGIVQKRITAEHVKSRLGEPDNFEKYHS